MKKIITKEDIFSLQIGAGILGSGGGGDSSLFAAIATQALNTYGSATLVSVDTITDDDFILPVGFMGAPLVAQEMLPSGDEFVWLYEEVSKFYGKKPTMLLAAEAGGGNIFAPLIVASRLSIPIVDGDLMGRAFPMLDMTTLTLQNIHLETSFMSDFVGNKVIIRAKNNRRVESIARSMSVEMGSSVAHIDCLLTGDQAKKTVIPGSISQAIALGAVVEQAKKDLLDPVNQLCTKYNGICFSVGIITALTQKIEDGFLRGSVQVTDAKGEVVTILFQNEFLVLYKNNIPTIMTPDIIVLLDVQTGLAIGADSLVYGQRVAVVGFTAPDVWKTEKGLALVGPKAFGYNFEYASPFKN